MMKFGLALIVAAILWVPFAASTHAQDDSTVTKTFELTLYGAVPEGESFSASYDIADAEDPPTELVLCGPGSDTACSGADGTRYTVSAELQRGVNYQTYFTRGTNGEVFAQRTEPVDTDMTNRAFYRFPTVGEDQQADDGGDDQQQVPELPSTGAGGLASGR